MQRIAREREGRCLSEKYINSKTELLWECKEGHQWNKSPKTTIYHNSWCPVCAGIKRYNIMDLQKHAEERGGSCLSKEYINWDTKYTWICSKNHQWESTWGNIKGGTWCPECRKLSTKDLQNLIGQKFSFLTVMKYIGFKTNDKTRKRHWYLCRCNCGNELEKTRNNLRLRRHQGFVRTCGLCDLGKGGKPLPERKINSVIGKRNDFLEVIAYTGYKKNGFSKKAHWYLCKCDCGNKTEIVRSSIGKNKSCGECDLTQGTKTAIFSDEQLNELIGQKFGQLTVLTYFGFEKRSRKTKQRWYRCQCDCGEKIETTRDQLTSGGIVSCGCLIGQYNLLSEEDINILVGQRFGKLTVLEFRERKNYKIGEEEAKVSKYYYTCRCDCGKKVDVERNNLRHNHTRSCGCFTESFGETESRMIFQRIFQREFPKKKPSWLKNPERNIMELDGYNRFLKLAFEYNGEQHYEFIEYFHQNEDGFQRRLRDDRLKRELCEKHGVTLIVIPYTIELDNLEVFIREECKKTRFLKEECKTVKKKTLLDYI